MRLGFEWMQQTRTHIRHGYKALLSLRLNFQVQHPHIGALPCPEPTTT